MTTQNKTQMGKLNQILFLAERSDTIKMGYINSTDETFKLYSNSNIMKDLSFMEFNFKDIDDVIKWIKDLIKTEIDTSYELANMKHRDYIRYYN